MEAWTAIVRTPILAIRATVAAAIAAEAIALDRTAVTSAAIAAEVRIAEVATAVVSVVVAVVARTVEVATAAWEALPALAVVVHTVVVVTSADADNLELRI